MIIQDEENQQLFASFELGSFEPITEMHLQIALQSSGSVVGTEEHCICKKKKKGRVFICVKL